MSRVLPRLSLSLSLALSLGGCATGAIEVRHLPDERPAAAAMTAADQATSLGKAAAALRAKAEEDEQDATTPPVTPADVPSIQTYDPWERLNRFTYRFNARLDEAFLLPVADQYRRVPPPIRGGVHNFFSNLTQLNSMLNYLLQGRIRLGLGSLGRFAVNSTLGVGGLFDVATHIGLRDRTTGLSTTLARWGMHPGPFLVIPLLGPSTLRDGIGLVGDFGTLYVANPAGFYRGDGSWYLDGLNALDRRASTDFRYYASGSPFEYDVVRFLYVRKRLIEDGTFPARSPPATDGSAPAGK